MPLIVCGINHHTAPLALRERFALDRNATKQVLQELQCRPAVNESVVLSTCNRMEIYGIVDPANAHNQSNQMAADIFAEWFKIKDPTQNLQPFLYQYQAEAGVRHLLRVASGLDSMVLGEPEIFGQVKTAYQLAMEEGSVNTELKQLFPAVFAACKQIRHQSGISQHPVSLAYATVQLAKRIFRDLSHCRVLLIGAGELIELMGLHLTKCGIKQLKVANRTLAHAEQLAATLHAQALRLEEVPSQLAQVDILITATHSPLPLIGKGMLEAALKTQKRRPLFMADLAVPRNIEPQVSQLADVYLYNMDALQQVINDNLQNRQQLSQLAEAMVETQILHYQRQQEVNKASLIIRRYRCYAETLRDQELARAQALLQRGANPADILQSLAHGLTNKLLHQPTIKLREAAYHQKLDLLQAAQALLEDT